MDQGSQELFEDLNTPSIHELFVYYDSLYFDTLLGNCVVEWSPKKMTRCGGICYPQPGGGCIIRLSEPLLKLRPSWELKNTIIHEMVHAWNFAKGHRDGKGGHGEHFHNKAHEINTSTKPDPLKPSRGYHIQQFHHMTDEVRFYQQHHWKCSKCDKLIQRAMNRKPQLADCRHWSKAKGDHFVCSDSQCGYHTHLSQCPHAEWVKVKEPEGFSDQKKRKRKSGEGGPAQRPRKGKDKTGAITDFFTGVGRLPVEEEGSPAAGGASPPQGTSRKASQERTGGFGSPEEMRRRAADAAMRRLAAAGGEGPSNSGIVSEGPGSPGLGSCGEAMNEQRGNGNGSKGKELPGAGNGDFGKLGGSEGSRKGGMTPPKGGVVRGDAKQPIVVDSDSDVVDLVSDVDDWAEDY